jgi:hypothetical protein
MRRDRDMPSPTKLPKRPNSSSWQYPSASSNQYDELNVQELLHGLEAESVNALHRERREPVEFSRSEPGDPEAVCHSCQRTNPANQRFCGYCGSKLTEPEPAVRDKARESWPFTPATRDFQSRDADRDLDPDLDDDDDADIHSEHEREDDEDLPRAAWPGGPGMTDDRAGSRRISVRDDELQFLRHTVSGDGEDSVRRRWKVGLVMLILAAAGFGGYRWYVSNQEAVPKYSAAPLPAETQDAPADDSSDARLPGQAQASQAAQPTVEPKADAASSRSGSSEMKRAGKSEAKTEVPPPQSAPSHLSVGGEATKPEPETQEIQIQKAPQEAPTAEATAAEGGQQELAVAQRYLSGASGVRDSGEAAKWLWRAVGKQNGPAIVLLSGLYARGDGVSKNCDQARLLLLTAVKKKVPAAAQGFQQLQLDGCQ